MPLPDHDAVCCPRHIFIDACALAIFQSVSAVEMPRECLSRAGSRERFMVWHIRTGCAGNRFAVFPASPDHFGHKFPATRTGAVHPWVERTLCSAPPPIAGGIRPSPGLFRRSWPCRVGKGFALLLEREANRSRIYHRFLLCRTYGSSDKSTLLN